MRIKQNKYLKLDLRGKEDFEGQERNGNNIQERQRNRIKNTQENSTAYKMENG